MVLKSGSGMVLFEVAFFGKRGIMSVKAMSSAQTVRWQNDCLQAVLPDCRVCITNSMIGRMPVSEETAGFRACTANVCIEQCQTDGK